MKKKVLVWVLLFVILVVGAFGIRSLVGSRPFKQLEVSEVDYYPLIRVSLGENAGMRYIDPIYTSPFVKMLNEMRVRPYYGRYDPFDDSVMYVLYRYTGEEYTLNRVGVTFEPKPLLIIGGKAYRISEEMATSYQRFWVNLNK